MPSSYFRCKGSDVLFENVTSHEYHDAIIPAASHFTFLLVKYLKPEIQGLSPNYVRPEPELAAPLSQLHRQCISPQQVPGLGGDAGALGWTSLLPIPSIAAKTDFRETCS